jgi:tetratricopeptide (TPR) repeat protein
LLRSGSSELTWSYSVAAPVGEESLLRERLARPISRVVACALRVEGKSARFAHETLRLIFSACEHLDQDGDELAVESWRRVVAAEPANALALATLALAEVERAQSEYFTSALQEGEISALRASARQHLKRSRMLDDQFGQTYAAEFLLIPSSHFAEQMATLNRGLARDPASDVLYGLLSDALQNVGRMDDAIDSARKATELEPGSPIWPGKLALVLAYNGFIKTARADLRDAELIWPESSDLKDARSHLEFRFGDAAKIVRDIDGGNLMPHMPAVFQNGATRAYFAARANPSPENVAEAVKLSSNNRERRKSCCKIWFRWVAPIWLMNI